MAAVKLSVVTLSAGAAILAAVALGPAPAAAAAFTVDLTHPIGTFAPLGGDIAKPDLNRPYKGSTSAPTFGAQAIYEQLPNIATNRGHFAMGRLLLSDHHGTHLDAPGHFINDKATAESMKPDRRTLDELGSDDLIGPVVYIDISARVRAILDKNGGKPSPDVKVTNFGNATQGVVTAADINAIAARLKSGVWIVVNAGWSRFFGGPDLATSPYINGWNHPGFSKAACDRLIEIEVSRKIRIGGLVMDNIGIDSGENARGPKGDLLTDSWHCHVRGLQRGWKFVENAASPGQLAPAKANSCTLFVGAPKTVAAAGGPARVMAMCQK